MSKTSSVRRDIKAVEEFHDLREEVKGIETEQDEGHWLMSEKLHEIKTVNAYLRWKFRSMQEYADSELSMTKRSCERYISVYKAYFVDLKKKLIGKKTGSDKVAAVKYHEKIVGQLKEISWTKSCIISTIAKHTNVEPMIADVKGLSTRETEAYVKQKRAEARGDTGDEKQIMMSFAFFEGQKSSVDMALEMAKKTSGSDKKGNNMALVCQDYVATNMIQDGEEKSLKLKHLEKFAAMLDVRLVIVDKSTRTVISGSKLMKQLAMKK